MFSRWLRRAVTQFPLLTDPGFIAAVEQTIAPQVLSEHKPAFEQQLGWLRVARAG